MNLLQQIRQEIRHAAKLHKMLFYKTDLQKLKTWIVNWKMRKPLELATKKARKP